MRDHYFKFLVGLRGSSRKTLYNQEISYDEKNMVGNLLKQNDKIVDDRNKSSRNSLVEARKAHANSSGPRGKTM